MRQRNEAELKILMPTNNCLFDLHRPISPPILTLSPYILICFILQTITGGVDTLLQVLHSSKVR
jgi:hypothetical protein